MVSEVRTMVTIIKEGHWEGHWDGGVLGTHSDLFLDFDVSLTSTLIL